jgi:hypothetical protein
MIGMVKTVFNDSWGWGGEPTVRIMDDRRDLTKVASTIFGCEYDAMKPDKNHVGFHLVALGDYEHFGLNRNFDGFSKESCLKYHPTFTKYGHVFEHHKNKDPKAKIGDIVKSAYNEKMGRVELMIHMHREKAAEHLARYDKDGEISFSMACKVPFDTCTKCASRRKNRKDPNACDHLKYEFGKTEKDGTVIGTMNPDPLWFDISAVLRPADRIAWDLKKVASFGDGMSQDEESGLILPDRIAMLSPEAAAKHAHMKKIAEFEDFYTELALGRIKVRGPRDAYLATIKQAGHTHVGDELISELRGFAPDSVFSSLADKGIILSPVSFFKYAFGVDFGEYADSMDSILEACATRFRSSVKSAECAAICNNDRYDVTEGDKLPATLLRKLAEASAVVGGEMQHRAIYSTSSCQMRKIAVDKTAGIVFNTACSQVLAEEYSAYKVAAVQAVVERFKSNIDTDSVYAVTASQNLFQE